MRTLFTLLFLSLFNLQNAMAQYPALTDGEFIPVSSCGLKVGVNLASISNMAHSYTFVGFHGGLYYEIRPRKNFGYSGEIAFTNQGVSSKGTAYIFNYLSLPLLANLYIGRATLQGGGYAAMLLNAMARNYPYKQDLGGMSPGLDYGLTAGFQIRAFKKIGVGARYYWGLQNVNQGFNRQATMHTRNLQLALNYDF